jgi:heparin binding hemagglutinin HbhA
MASSPRNIKTPRPVYAVVGAGDLAVEKLREVSREVHVPKTDVKTVRDQLQSQVESQVKNVQAQAKTAQAQVRTAPAKTQAAVTEALNEALAQANTVYDDLAARGKSLVTRIRRQQATQDLEAAVDNTVSQAKATKTTAKKAAKSTRTRAKATTTSARKTADAAGRAVQDAADKVGD